MSASIAASLPTSITTHSSSTLKRKREGQEQEPQRRSARNFTFSIGDGSQKRQRVLAPVCLIHRARVPLAWLDPNGDGVRQVTGDVGLLEHQRTEPTVLVAEEQSTKRYHAIEAAGRRTYTMCRLASGVEKKTVVRRAVAIYNTVTSSRSSARSDVAANIKVEDETDNMSIMADTQSISASSIAIAPSTVAAFEEPSSKSAPQQEPALPPVVSTVSQLEDSSLVEQTSDLPSETTVPPAEDLLKDLAKHYLSELYLSRTSLAYFVKGPFTRARLAFESSTETDHMQQLAAFLNELIISTTTSEERSRKTIPDIIHAKCAVNDASAQKPKKRKNSKSWKAKRDRHGMLPQETEHVEDWWQRVENDELSESTASLESVIKRRLLQLRKRETFLQIIIILEALSLEQAHPAPVEVGDKEQDKQQAEKLGSKGRAKKKTSHKELLDVLLDKLTIWYSVDSNSPQKGTANNQETKAEVNDELKNFCVEIIIPFYMVRLPKIATSINKKLGGPSAPTPVKRSSSSSKPGQSAQRKPLMEKRSRNSLQRTATDTNLIRKATPSLHRSATDSQLQDNMIFKRERSQSVSLHSVPTAHRRLGSSAFVREIDLTARTAANDEKMRRKAEQEAKVKAAIAGIRKPDRSLALKENAARVDARFAETLTKQKKAPIAQPSMLVDSKDVSIAATPRISRLFKSTPQKQKQTTRQPTDGPPQASLSIADLDSGSAAIPQTGHRDRLQATISATPCREPLHNPFELAALASLADSPAAQRGNIVAGTPMRPRTLFLLPETPLTKLVRHDERNRSSTTPIKDALIEASPNVIRQEKQEQKSVYDVLGWNDDNYEPLA